MTRKEAIRQTHQQDTLRQLGFTIAEADALRRISMTLHRWHELECGTENAAGSSLSVERDDNGEGKPFCRIQYATPHGYVDRKYPIADRETGARKLGARTIKRTSRPASTCRALSFTAVRSPERCRRASDTDRGHVRMIARY
jgi:hypothetical protein